MDRFYFDKKRGCFTTEKETNESGRYLEYRQSPNFQIFESWETVSEDGNKKVVNIAYDILNYIDPVMNPIIKETVMDNNQVKADRLLCTFIPKKYYEIYMEEAEKWGNPLRVYA